MNHVNLNCQSSLQDSLYLNTNYNYQTSASTINMMNQNGLMKEQTMRRDSEIERHFLIWFMIFNCKKCLNCFLLWIRLKMRIILLEQQLDGGQMKHQPNLNSECSVGKMSYENSLIRNEVTSLNAKDEQISKLDRYLKFESENWDFWSTFYIFVLDV